MSAAEAGLPPTPPQQPGRGVDGGVSASPEGMTRGRRRRPGPSLVIGALIVLGVVAMALVSFVWTPYDPTLVDPASRLAKPSPEHLLGTDKFGRDVFSQLLVGARTTLFVGIVAVGVAALIGVPLGILAAMATRWFGEVLMRGTDLLLAFPALLLAIMFSAVYGGSTLVAMIAIGIATVPAFVRLIRSGALQVMRTEYVLAARAAGRSPFAIGVRHVLPNVGSLVIVQASVSFAIAVLAEAALSFLGFGTPPPTPSWGRMLQESQEMLFSAPRLALFPGLAIAVAVLGFNLLGDGLRDYLDPRLEDRR
jgi:peptide/nickel transport system permease protein